LTDYLERLDERIPVTVRPHPKASPKKINSLKNRLSVSESRSLAEDVSKHDVVVTVNSTAIFEAVIQGKHCCVLQLPWYGVEFEPFTHDHIGQLSTDSVDIADALSDRSVQTQKDYLQRFCYLPSTDGSDRADSSEELVALHIAGQEFDE